MHHNISKLSACAVATAAVLLATSCGDMNNMKTVQNALDGSDSPASVNLGDLMPSPQKAAVVCPNAGEEANALFDQKLFKDEDLDETLNWLVTKVENGAVVKERFNRSEVELCEGQTGLREFDPASDLVFEKVERTWVLQQN